MTMTNGNDGLKDELAGEGGYRRDMERLRDSGSLMS